MQDQTFRFQDVEIHVPLGQWEQAIREAEAVAMIAAAKKLRLELRQVTPKRTGRMKRRVRVIEIPNPLTLSGAVGWRGLRYAAPVLSREEGKQWRKRWGDRWRALYEAERPRAYRAAGLSD